LLDLIDETLKLPQRPVVRLVAEPGAELVVVVVLNSCGRKVTVARLQVLMRGSRAAVKQQHLQLRIVTHPLGPYGKPAVRRVDGNAACSAAQPISTPGIIKIAIGRTHQSSPMAAERDRVRRIVSSAPGRSEQRPPFSRLPARGQG
jgi:hypothetical protein